jgi:hypothetical protein
MNLRLAMLLDSIPKEFTVTRRKNRGIVYKHKKKIISIHWFGNGNPKSVRFFEDNKQHRPLAEGPAIQTWLDNGQVHSVIYCVDGEEVTHPGSVSSPNDLTVIFGPAWPGFDSFRTFQHYQREVHFSGRNKL